MPDFTEKDLQLEELYKAKDRHTAFGSNMDSIDTQTLKNAGIKDPRMNSVNAIFELFVMAKHGIPLKDIPKFEMGQLEGHDKAAYLEEYHTFLKEHPLTTTDENGTVTKHPEHAKAWGELYREASKALSEYRLPDVDFGNPATFKDHIDEIAMLSSIGTDLVQVIDVQFDFDDPALSEGYLQGMGSMKNAMDFRSNCVMLQDTKAFLDNATYPGKRGDFNLQYTQAASARHFASKHKDLYAGKTLKEFHQNIPYHLSLNSFVSMPHSLMRMDTFSAGDQKALQDFMEKGTPLPEKLARVFETDHQMLETLFQGIQEKDVDHNLDDFDKDNKLAPYEDLLVSNGEAIDPADMNEAQQQAALEGFAVYFAGAYLGTYVNSVNLAMNDMDVFDLIRVNGKPLKEHCAEKYDAGKPVYGEGLKWNDLTDAQKERYMKLETMRSTVSPEDTVECRNLAVDLNAKPSISEAGREAGRTDPEFAAARNAGEAALAWYQATNRISYREANSEFEDFVRTPAALRCRLRDAPIGPHSVFTIWMMGHKGYSMQQVIDMYRPESLADPVKSAAKAELVKEFKQYVTDHPTDASPGDPSEPIPENLREWGRIYGEATRKIMDYQVPDVSLSDRKGVLPYMTDYTMIFNLGINLVQEGERMFHQGTDPGYMGPFVEGLGGQDALINMVAAGGALQLVGNGIKENYKSDSKLLLEQSVKNRAAAKKHFHENQSVYRGKTVAAITKDYNALLATMGSNTFKDLDDLENGPEKIEERIRQVKKYVDEEIPGDPMVDELYEDVKQNNVSLIGTEVGNVTQKLDTFTNNAAVQRYKLFRKDDGSLKEVSELTPEELNQAMDLFQCSYGVALSAPGYIAVCNDAGLTYEDILRINGTPVKELYGGKYAHLNGLERDKAIMAEVMRASLVSGNQFSINAPKHDLKTNRLVPGDPVPIKSTRQISILNMIDQAKKQQKAAGEALEGAIRQDLGKLDSEAREDLQDNLPELQRGKAEADYRVNTQVSILNTYLKAAGIKEIAAGAGPQQIEAALNQLMAVQDQADKIIDAFNGIAFPDVMSRQDQVEEPFAKTLESLGEKTENTDDRILLSWADDYLIVPKDEVRTYYATSGDPTLSAGLILNLAETEALERNAPDPGPPSFSDETKEKMLAVFNRMEEMALVPEKPDFSLNDPQNPYGYRKVIEERKNLEEVLGGEEPDLEDVLEAAQSYKEACDAMDNLQDEVLKQFPYNDNPVPGHLSTLRNKDVPWQFASDPELDSKVNGLYQIYHNCKALGIKPEDFLNDPAGTLTEKLQTLADENSLDALTKDQSWNDSCINLVRNGRPGYEKQSLNELFNKKTGGAKLIESMLDAAAMYETDPDKRARMLRANHALKEKLNREILEPGMKDLNFFSDRHKAASRGDQTAREQIQSAMTLAFLDGGPVKEEHIRMAQADKDEREAAMDAMLAVPDQYDKLSAMMDTAKPMLDKGFSRQALGQDGQEKADPKNAYLDEAAKKAVVESAFKYLMRHPEDIGKQAYMDLGKKALEMDKAYHLGMTDQYKNWKQEMTDLKHSMTDPDEALNTEVEKLQTDLVRIHMKNVNQRQKGKTVSEKDLKKEENLRSAIRRKAGARIEELENGYRNYKVTGTYLENRTKQLQQLMAHPMESMAGKSRVFAKPEDNVTALKQAQQHSALTEHPELKSLDAYIQSRTDAKPENWRTMSQAEKGVWHNSHTTKSDFSDEEWEAMYENALSQPGIRTRFLPGEEKALQEDRILAEDEAKTFESRWEKEQQQKEMLDDFRAEMSKHPAPAGRQREQAPDADVYDAAIKTGIKTREQMGMYDSFDQMQAEMGKEKILKSVAACLVGDMCAQTGTLPYDMSPKCLANHMSKDKSFTKVMDVIMENATPKQMKEMLEDHTIYAAMNMQHRLNKSGVSASKEAGQAEAGQDPVRKHLTEQINMRKQKEAEVMQL